MAPLSVEVAQIAGLFTEAILYGIYLIMFASAIRLLLYSNGRIKFTSKAPLHYPLVTATLAIFVFTTLDVIFTLQRTMDAFVYHDDPAIRLNDHSYWKARSYHYSSRSVLGRFGLCSCGHVATRLFSPWR